MVNMIVRMRRWVVRKIILTIRYTDTVWRRSHVAKPEVSVNAGSAGLIEIDNVGRLSFTHMF